MKEWIICDVWIIMYEVVVHLCCVDHYVWRSVSFGLCGSLCMKEWIICVEWIIMYEGMDHLDCVDHYV